MFVGIVFTFKWLRQARVAFGSAQGQANFLPPAAAPASSAPPALPVPLLLPATHLHKVRAQSTLSWAHLTRPHLLHSLSQRALIYLPLPRNLAVASASRQLALRLLRPSLRHLKKWEPKFHPSLKHTTIITKLGDVKTNDLLIDL